jgi:hypothetical protein
MFLARSVLLLAGCLLAPSIWAAALLQTPEGGRIVLADQVFCGPAPEGWTYDAERRAARAGAGARPGVAVDVAVASDATGCGGSRDNVQLLVTGPLPAIDPASVTLWADEGRLEWRGTKLRGVQIHWRTRVRSGDDTCLLPNPAGDAEQCAVAIDRGVPSDVALRWLPAGAVRGAEVRTFDIAGRPLSVDAWTLKPARVILARALPSTQAVDMSEGLGHIDLPHPEAVVGVDCGTARCDLTEGEVVVRSVPGGVSAVNVKVRLAPHVAIQRGESLDSTASATFALLRCPLVLLSRTPIREIDDTRVVVRIDARCSKDPRALRWTAEGDTADVLRAERDGDGWLVALRVGRLTDDRVTFNASRSEPDAPVLATLTEKTRPLPPLRVAVSLPGLGPIDFVPRNREALVKVAPVDEHTRAVLLPVAGALKVKPAAEGFLVHAEDTVGGVIPLRFGIRSDLVPAALANVDLAVVTDAVHRPLREARVPVSLVGSTERPPVVELLCGGQRVTAGEPLQVAFDQRDACRLVVHRGRLRPEDGPQELQIEVEVVGLDGVLRPGTRVSERLLLRPGANEAPAEREFWFHGVRAPFDRLQVRVYHVVDDARYLGEGVALGNAAAAQWTVICGQGRVRFYATMAFPSGLYRVTDPTGQLSLSFGVLSRLVFLDRTGKDGLIGIELGAISVGLAGNASIPSFPPTLATVAGVGVGIPLGNAGQPTQASLNLHAWVSREFRSDFQYFAADDPGRTRPLTASHWAFIFGPSISIGNVGTVL